jgi:undecaprenyl-diphosphatase
VTLLEATVLGVVQGLSEFLPISSSAHLILTSRALGWTDQGLQFDVAANSGSLLAVMIYVRRELIQIMGGAWRSLSGLSRGTRYRLSEGSLALILAVATVPVGIAGWITRDLIATAGRNPAIIAMTSILFALVLWIADRRPEGDVYLADIRVRMALWVGFAQALALIPGTSRAGITLTAALLLGFRREAAVRFSFLLAVPVGLVVAGGELVELIGGDLVETDLVSLAIVLAVSAVSAYAAIVWLLSWIRHRSLQIFVIYRIMLAVAILATMVW